MRCPFTTRLYLSHKTSFVRPFPVRPAGTVGFSMASFPEAPARLLVQGDRDVAHRVECLRGDKRTHITAKNTTTGTHSRPARCRLALVTLTGSNPSSACGWIRFLVVPNSSMFEFMTRRAFVELVALVFLRARDSVSGGSGIGGQ